MLFLKVNSKLLLKIKSLKTKNEIEIINLIDFPFTKHSVNALSFNLYKLLF